MIRSPGWSCVEASTVLTADVALTTGTTSAGSACSNLATSSHAPCNLSFSMRGKGLQVELSGSRIKNCQC